MAIEAIKSNWHESVMKIAETVTFGGSRLPRVAEIRGKVSKAQRAAADYIVLWRGKPLFDDSGLYRVPSDHQVLEQANESHILLGQDNEKLVFAVDISGWTGD